MERKPNYILLLLAMLSICSLLGFARSYLFRLADFRLISIAIHLHFLIFITWTSLIFIQVLLIKKKKTALHRRSGLLAFVLVPLMVISVFSIAHEILYQSSDRFQAALIPATGAITDTCTFVALFTLAMWHRHRVHKHAAYHIGASIVVFNPGIGRLVASVAGQLSGIVVMVFLPIVIVLACAFYERQKLKRALLRSPYLVVLGIWILDVLAFIALPQFGFWTKFMRQLA